MGDWRIGPIQKVSALESRVGWTPAHIQRAAVEVWYLWLACCVWFRMGH